METVPTPSHYGDWEPSTPRTISVWKVHGKLKVKNIGLVADGYGFEDTPDSEWISGGFNTKGPRAAALAREACFFHWGFAADPEEMTPEARLVFLNVLAYMKQFDGHRPLQKKVTRHRKWAPLYARYLRTKTSVQYAERLLDLKILERHEYDADRVRAYLTQNLDFVWRGPDRRYTVDEDAKAMGWPNNSVELLAECLRRWTAGKDVERARRLLRRYTGRKFEDLASWRRWFEENRERLYFSDTAGFRFFVTP